MPALSHVFGAGEFQNGNVRAQLCSFPLLIERYDIENPSGALPLWACRFADIWRPPPRDGLRLGGYRPRTHHPDASHRRTGSTKNHASDPPPSSARPTEYA